VCGVREMFSQPLHPYARALISSLPSLEAKGVFRGIPGLAPSLLRLPGGCSFHPRCPQAMPICATAVPASLIRPGARQVACHLYKETE
jgi:peptide/nickel transport system ATP-binding protein